ncbi:hypothetical protein WKK05_04635 [Nostoc sp. UHCC 0302]|uniref:hypothetical protein n=1 Tax=Nostoc sp. UHCC 0302 TaxID=3134896 RepID=UPI00311CB659
MKRRFFDPSTALRVKLFLQCAIASHGYADFLLAQAATFVFDFKTLWLIDFFG